jgi:hypothetical protein
MGLVTSSVSLIMKFPGAVTPKSAPTTLKLTVVESAVPLLSMPWKRTGNVSLRVPPLGTQIWYTQWLPARLGFTPLVLVRAVTVIVSFGGGGPANADQAAQHNAVQTKAFNIVFISLFLTSF